MIAKTWNVRDQTREELNNLLTKKYKEIEEAFKMLRKVSDINDAKKSSMKYGEQKNWQTT